MSRLFSIISTILLVCILASTSFADEIMPCADSEFASATTTLQASKQVSFRAVTNNVKSSISVTACWLEKENSDGTWTWVCSLPAPDYVASGTFAYSTTKDYSSYIGTGTYRVQATYNADGHSITRCSNERTF